MKLKKAEEVFLSLLKGSVIGVTKYRDFQPLTDKEWEGVYHLAEVQGMVPVLLAEMDKLSRSSSGCSQAHQASQSNGASGETLKPLNSETGSLLPPMDMLMDWLGQASYRETTYQQQLEQSCMFADALAKEGVLCLVLKGLAVGEYYPVKNSREFGDLDCFLVKKVENVKNVQNVASEGKTSEPSELSEPKYTLAFSIGNEVARRKGAKVEQSGYKHTHIHLKDLLIENHEYLTNFNETRQGIKTEKILRGLALEGGYKRIGETNLWIPKPEFNVLFLLNHSLGDFIANDMTIKAVYDWAVFLKAEQRHIDWKRMEVLLDECRLRAFFDLMTEAALTYLGLELYCGEINITSHRRMSDWLIEDVLDIPVNGKKTIWVMVKRFVDRVKRMVKYHRITTERIRTSLLKTIIYRFPRNRKVSLE